MVATSLTASPCTDDALASLPRFTRCSPSLTKSKNRVHVIPMRAANRRSAARALLLLSLAACAACAAQSPTPTSAPPRSIALLESASEGYATLLRIADSLTTAGAAASGEAAQSTARTIADRIAPLRGEFEDVTVSMSTSELEQTRSLWMRLALSHSALGERYRPGRTLSAGPA